jgi:hypothetical protein
MVRLCGWVCGPGSRRIREAIVRETKCTCHVASKELVMLSAAKHPLRGLPTRRSSHHDAAPRKHSPRSLKVRNDNKNIMTNIRFFRHCVSRNDEKMMCHSERSKESSPSVSHLVDPSQKMLRMTKRTQSCRRGSLNCFVKSTWVVIYHFHIKRIYL